MAAIPAKLFRVVEWHLHHESGLVETAVQRRREIIENAVVACGPKIDGMPHGKGSHSDATAKAALALVKASGEVEQARAWAQAIRETYDYYDDTPVFKMAVSYYGHDVTIRALAALLGESEKTLDRQRDKFVSTCAVFAAAKGLVGTVNTYEADIT
jgi:hypothetical protein